MLFRSREPDPEECSFQTHLRNNPSKVYSVLIRCPPDPRETQYIEQVGTLSTSTASVVYCQVDLPAVVGKNLCNHSTLVLARAGTR